jgi:hypothetical protein
MAPFGELNTLIANDVSRMMLVGHKGIHFKVRTPLKIDQLRPAGKRAAFAACHPFCTGQGPCTQGVPIRFQPPAGRALSAPIPVYFLVMKKNLKVFVCVRDVGSQIIKIIHQEHLDLMAKPIF